MPLAEVLDPDGRVGLITSSDGPESVCHLLDQRINASNYIVDHAADDRQAVPRSQRFFWQAWARSSRSTRNPAMPATPMPAAFLGHGSPMNTLERNRYTQAWRAFGASVPRPRAILMVSAHWFVNATAVTAMPRPRTIHDFYGFPQALFDVQYAAPGLPELAEEVADAVAPDFVAADTESWGLDHGTWSVLVHAFPEADIPVVQLSINATRPAEWHLAMGAKLAALRGQGVLVMGSGNVVHNLRAMDRASADRGFDWAQRFNETAIDLATSRPGDAAALVGDADFAKVAPTPEHFLPFLYIAGFGAQAGTPLEVLVDGYAYGSLSMTSFVAGCAPKAPEPGLEGAPPMGSDAPGENSNM